MILRRVIQHFRQQEWTAIALDFIIVVVGVFIGLQVQEWSERQEDRRREVRIVSDMLADLDMDRAQYANSMVLAPRRISAANTSLVGAGLSPIEFDWQVNNSDIDNYTFDFSQASEYPADQLDRIWTDVVLGFHPTPSTSAYDAMIGSGDLRIIHDREIVRAIQNYQNRVSVVMTQNEKLLAIRADVLQTGATYGLAPYAVHPAGDYFRQMSSEPGLAASVRNMATFVIFHYGDIKRADDEAAALQVRLRDYLETMK